LSKRGVRDHVLLERRGIPIAAQMEETNLMIDNKESLDIGLNQIDVPNEHSMRLDATYKSVFADALPCNPVVQPIL
jgi:hypothetical protein